MVNTNSSIDHFVIIDDFLSEQDHQAVWHYIQTEEFQQIHQKKWIKAFRLSDGEGLWGPPCLSDKYQADTQNAVYPSGKGIDLVIQKLKKIVPKYSDLIGRQGQDWDYFFARPYLYPKSTGLSWHRDNPNYVKGAFVYYAHPHWSAQWGGELLVSSSETAELEFPKQRLYQEEDRYLGSHLDNTFESDALINDGIGHYILPKPNRLVLMGTGVFHTVKRVDDNAGDQVRATIQGFFVFFD